VHVALVAQGMAHPPQFPGSVLSSTQMLPPSLRGHCVSVPEQTHWLLMHVAPTPHGLLQPPQLFGSIEVSTQVPEHTVSPVGQ
jgi:hypothetical protein